MKNGIEKLLNKIGSLSKGSAVYLLESSKKGTNVLSFTGRSIADKKKFAELNKLITRKRAPSLTEIKKSTSFATLAKKSGFINIYRERIFKSKERRIFLVIFTKTKFEDSKSLQKKLVGTIKSVIKNISGEHDKINSGTQKKASPGKNTKHEELEHIFAELAGSIRPVLYSLNPITSEYLFISESVRTLFGYSPEDIYNNKFLISRSIDKDSLNDFNIFMEKLRSGEGASVDYKIKDRFGKENWVRHFGTPIFKSGKIIHIIGMIDEITEEIILKAKLHNTEERFRLLIDTADDLIFVLNGFGYFSMVNKNGANTLGYTPEEMIGRHFLEFIDKEDESKIANAFNEILKSNKVTTFETVFLDRFDKGVTFEIHAKPLITDGEVSGMISIGRNISGRKSDEQKIRELNVKLIEANRIISIERERARHKIGVLEEVNKLKSEFISNISHELRTPLASVVGFAETIASDPDLPKETLVEFSNIILSEGKRLAKLINDVLDFSKLESGEEEIKFEEVDVVSTLNNVADLFQEQINKKNLVLTKEFSHESVIISADNKRLNQIFTNLISNSIKFTNPGGRISLIVSDYGKEVEFAVTDTGIGIPEKDLPKLFQKFTKIQRPGVSITGTGFGLVAVKQIVDMHKGLIRVKSQEEKGTTFIIRLPKQQYNRG